jgi:hypothetical protein
MSLAVQPSESRRVPKNAAGRSALPNSDRHILSSSCVFGDGTSLAYTSANQSHAWNTVSTGGLDAGDRRAEGRPP